MKGNVVIIDDSISDIKVASAVIEREGYTCQSFLNPSEAYEWMKLNKPRLILVDLMMPEVSGFEVITFIRSIPELTNVPISVFSGRNSTDDVKKAIGLGAIDYMLKPLDPLVLQEKLRRHYDSTKSDFVEIPIADNFSKEARVLTPIEITSFSEFGLTALLNGNLELGQIIEVGLGEHSYFGVDKVLLRCLTSRTKEGRFEVQMTFVGLTEQGRQAIRLAVRKAWIESKEKKNESA